MKTDQDTDILGTVAAEEDNHEGLDSLDNLDTEVAGTGVVDNGVVGTGTVDIEVVDILRKDADTAMQAVDTEIADTLEVVDIQSADTEIEVETGIVDIDSEVESEIEIEIEIVDIEVEVENTVLLVQASHIVLHNQMVDWY